ncbi:hypothetical protein [Gloeothece verrucosa]|uniref:Uncharacterized protein n=1 Tax=Gloeothece verrucosa (strain PCC 7822) TaxID=497965 RepID=E0U7A5_GLOV7|nr:hypothetical protein [Gloeothece verrucosa]ADN12492.1 hypothetical protein Cyan7822_0447 [Gloeothece verrucosa PCC 7822]
MYATINEFLFPIFLFAVYFCAVSNLIYQPQKFFTVHPALPASSSQLDDTNTVDDLSFEEQLRPKTESEEISLIIENENASFEPVNPELPTENISNPKQDNNLYTQTETLINNLKKRQCRKLCKPLGIQQKCGKVEKSLALLKAEICTILKDDSHHVITVIEEQLPELISVFNQISEIDEIIAS